ncbi:MAG: PaaI family thioesterase [Chloroflexi bacterium]|nr:PaaI family thioesterase [Chloroflexota bacterium]
MPDLARLEQLFSNAPCNQHLAPQFIARKGEAEVIIKVRPDMLHGGGVVHGSIIFKALDDAATIAAMSLLEDQATLTASFNLYFLRPITSGEIRATGRVIKLGQRQIIAEAVAVDENGRELARGSGTFMAVSISASQPVS